MKGKIILSAVLIVVVIAAALGVTMAWFTDDASTNNLFTAGTLIIDADDEWTNADPITENWENANPGDCEPKEFTITNNGTKNMYVRFAFTGNWTIVPNDPGGPWNDDLVTVTPGPGFSNNWTELEIGGVTYWFYNGILAPTGTQIFTFNVCLDGPGTGNEYQGATYAAEFTFNAIQVTHTASFDIWTAGYYEPLADRGWYEITNIAPYEMVVDGSTLTWTPTGSGIANYIGW